MLVRPLSGHELNHAQIQPLPKRYESEIFFNGKIHKLVSVLASLASVRFNHMCLADDTLRERTQKRCRSLIVGCFSFLTAPRRERIPLAREGRYKERDQNLKYLINVAHGPSRCPVFICFYLTSCFFLRGVLQ
jgi:hypothetical protein